MKGDKYLLNGTERKDWASRKGDVDRHFRLQDVVDEKVAKLEEEFGELREVHGKDEAKFRNSGKKIREQKAAVRRKEMDTLLERQGREYMAMAEESTRRDFHFINKYDREIEWLERRNKKYHDDRWVDEAASETEREAESEASSKRLERQTYTCTHSLLLLLGSNLQSWW